MGGEQLQPQQRLLYLHCPAGGRHAIPHTAVRACVHASVLGETQTKNTAGHDGVTFKRIGPYYYDVYYYHYYW